MLPPLSSNAGQPPGDAVNRGTKQACFLLPATRTRISSATDDDLRLQTSAVSAGDEEQRQVASGTDQRARRQGMRRSLMVQPYDGDLDRDL